MKHLDRSIWIIVACLAIAAPLALAQDDTEETEIIGTGSSDDTDETEIIGTDSSDDIEETEVIGPGSPDGADGEEPADGADDEPADGEVDDGKGRGQGMPSWMLPAMIGALLLFYVMSSRGKKKRETKHREMLASLKKGDKVTSIGGICGTVVEVKEDEITVKVDETNNVRMHFARWAIRGIGDTGKTENPDQEQRK